MIVILGFMIGMLIGAAIIAALGVAVAWVLDYFGLIVPWYVCAVAIFLISCIFRSR